MYCSHCGAPATGNFCSSCGTALRPPVQAPAAPPVQAPAAPPAPAPAAPLVHWDHDVRYDLIVAVPEVRDRIAAHAAAASTPLSGEDFLALCDKAFQPVLGGVPIAKVAALAAPVYARLGVRTGKDRAQVFARPAGRVLADVLCALAGNGYGIREVRQGADGCVLECTLPSDWRSFAGELVVAVERLPHGTGVRAATKIPGQLYDWGKSKQILDRVFAAIPPR